MSVLYITHDLGVVANIADRVYVMYAGIITEQGNTAQIFHDARHPYTQGLLASLPSRSKRGKRLYSIPGAVPNPATSRWVVPFILGVPMQSFLAVKNIPRCAITAKGTWQDARYYLKIDGNNE